MWGEFFSFLFPFLEHHLEHNCKRITMKQFQWGWAIVMAPACTRASKSDGWLRAKWPCWGATTTLAPYILFGLMCLSHAHPCFLSAQLALREQLWKLWDCSACTQIGRVLEKRAAWALSWKGKAPNAFQEKLTYANMLYVLFHVHILFSVTHESGKRQCELGYSLKVNFFSISYYL